MSHDAFDLAHIKFLYFDDFSFETCSDGVGRVAWSFASHPFGLICQGETGISEYLSKIHSPRSEPPDCVIVADCRIRRDTRLE